MAKSGLKHIDVGAELTRTEWESEESHELVHGTSFPSSPVERQLFYRDDEHKWYIYNGTEWVWLGGGSGGGMEVHGNEYHDPDFATEAAFLAHKERHGYLGADELPILYLNAQRAIPMINKHFGDLGGLTEGHSGGSLTPGIVYGTLRSGSSNNNYGRVYMSQACYHAYSAYGHTLGIKISIRQATNQDMWLGWFESTTPGTNQKHYAFRIVNSSLYAYAGVNDSNKWSSDALTTWGGTRDLFLSLNDGSADNGIRFYVDHQLKASVTNSSYRPAGALLYLVFYLKTTEAANKDCFLCPFTLFTAHSH